MKRGRRLALSLGAISLVALAIVGIALHEDIAAAFWLSRFESGDAKERERAARWLADLRVEKAAPALASHWVESGLEDDWALDAVLALEPSAHVAIANRVAAEPLETQLRALRNLIERRTSAGVIASITRIALAAPHPLAGLRVSELLSAARHPCVVDALFESLRSPHPRGRETTTNAIALLGAAADRSLAPLLNDPSPWLRAGALEVYAFRRDPPFEPPTEGLQATVLRVARDGLRDEDAIVRVAAIKLLDSWEPESQPWPGALEDPLLQVRAAAVEHFAIRASSEQLVRAMRDEHPSIRLAALDAWAKCANSVRPERALHLALLNDESELVRSRALRLLDAPALSDVQLAVAAFRDARSWSFALELVEKLEAKGIDPSAPLLAALDDASLAPGSRLGVVRALGRLKNQTPSVREALERAARGDDTPLAFLARHALDASSGATGEPAVLAADDAIRDARDAAGSRLHLVRVESESRAVARVAAVFRVEVELLDPIDGWEIRFDLTPGEAELVRTGADDEPQILTERRVNAVFTVGAIGDIEGEPRVLWPGRHTLGRVAVTRGDGAATTPLALRWIDGRLSLRSESRALAMPTAPDWILAPGVESAIAIASPAATDPRATPDTLLEGTKPADEKAIEPHNELRHEKTDDGVRVFWTLAKSTPVVLLRDGDELARLDARTRSFIDHPPERPVRYEVVPAKESELASLSMLRFPEERYFLYEAETTRLAPGAKLAPIRILATTSLPSQGYSIGLRIASQDITVREIVRGVDSASAESLFPQKHAFASGEFAVGLLQDMVPPQDPALPEGMRQHVFSVLVDVSESAPHGLVVPIDIGPFGKPPGANTFSVNVGARATSMDAFGLRGSLIVSSDEPQPLVAPLPAPLTALDIDRKLKSGTQSFVLSWDARPGSASGEEFIEIERNGTRIAELPGDRTSFTDASPGPLPVLYQLRVRRGQDRSEPRSARWLFPDGMPPWRPLLGTEP